MTTTYSGNEQEDHIASAIAIDEGFKEDDMILLRTRDLKKQKIIFVASLVLAVFAGVLVAGIFIGGWSISNKHPSSTVSNALPQISTDETNPTTTGNNANGPADISSSGPPSFAPSNLPSAVNPLSFVETLSGKEDLSDPSSPQSKAFHWIESQDVINYSKEKIQQRYAIATFLFATLTTEDERALSAEGGADWLLPEVDECDYVGITCNDKGVVTAIELNFRGLVGQLPSELGYLVHLQSLSLEENQLYGQMPDALLELNELRYLRLNGNNLSGPIGDIRNMSALEVLDLSSNSFQGSLHSKGIGSIRYLNELRVNNNLFTGDFPLEITDLLYLDTFIADNNKIWGDIHPMIEKLVYLRTFSVSDNEMFGKIPDVIFRNMRNLEILHLDGNAFTGCLPDSFINDVVSPALREVKLERNSFEGKIFMGRVKSSSSWSSSSLSEDDFKKRKCDLSLDVLTADLDSVNCKCCTNQS